MADVKLVIRIPEIEYEHLTNKEKFYSLTKSKQEWLVNKTLNRVVDGTPIPYNATNGDVIKVMFPNIPIDEGDFLVRKSRFDNTAYWKDWWNAPYKIESEEKHDK